MSQFKPLTYQELMELRDRSIKCYNGIPIHARMEGQTFPLTEEEKRFVAYFEATVILLNRKGYLQDGAAEQALKYMNDDCTINEEGLVGHSTAMERKR